jgi:DDE superfamily endonuclease
VWQHVQVLMTGTVLAPGKRTVTAMLQMMGRSAAFDFQTYHRVLNRAVWSPLTASRLLLRLLEPISKEEDTSQCESLEIGGWSTKRSLAHTAWLLQTRLR